MASFWFTNRAALWNGDTKPVDYPFNYSTGASIYVNLPQDKPSPTACDPTRLQSLTSGGIQVLLMDGSVRNVSLSISPATWGRAFVANDGGVMGSEW
jgi:hypothetical protein